MGRAMRPYQSMAQRFDVVGAGILRLGHWRRKSQTWSGRVANQVVADAQASEDRRNGLGVYSGHSEKQARYCDEESVEQEHER